MLQGFYQSNQATAAACQVNNLHLLRGMLGRPGAGIYQMNGQPTAQNTRETGADGDLSGFRNWENKQHIRELAELWNVDEMTIPHWSPPTHAMQIWRYAEQGSIKLLWISATNPAVSLPELARVRRILARDDLMVVVQDMFLTETACLADVVLPAAGWGEKLGTFTNVDRTVHLSERAVEPPGEARSDLDIFLEYARRMGFRDRDGAPLIKWHDAESAFEAWKACSAGRPCDYTGMTYDLLRGGSGIQWPCTADAPDGTERLYADGHFNTDPDDCETFGQDLTTGAALGEQAYRAKDPRGRAFLHAADYEPFPEAPDEDYPLLLTTGRTLYHFHTRTKTGRAPQLAGRGSRRVGRGESRGRRGAGCARAISPPWSRGEVSCRAACASRTSARASCSSRSTTATGIGRMTKDRAPPTSSRGRAGTRSPSSRSSRSPRCAFASSGMAPVPPPRPRPSPRRHRQERTADMHLAHYLALLHRSQAELGDAFRTVARSHADEHDVHGHVREAGVAMRASRRATRPVRGALRRGRAQRARRLHSEIFGGPRDGPLGLLRDLHDVYLLACECDLAWTLVGQAAQGARDRELLAVVQTCEGETAMQLTWARGRMKQAAPQALVVAS